MVVSLYTMLFLVACVKDNDYKIPDVSIQEPNIPSDKITSFQAIKSRFEQAKANELPIAIIKSDEELYIEGYVISSDKAGNFFEELIIQNKMDDSNPDTDPRLGFRLSVNVSNLSDTYEVGRKVYVKMNGLTVGESNGVMVIGKGEGIQVEQIQEYEYKDIIIRSTEIVELIPKVSTLLDLTEADENTLVQLENMQIHRHQRGFTYAGEGIDEFDGLRTLESCSDIGTIALQTSTFSDFKSLQVPQLKGTVKGIFARDFSDEQNVLIVNSIADINFNEEARCDPTELDCGIALEGGTENLFFEDFQSQTNNRLITGNGWTNYIEVGSEGWEAFTATGTNASLGRSARMRSASSGDASNIAWLITPAINLDGYNEVTLQFKTSSSFADGSQMEVMYSLDWDGLEEHITSATWGILSAGYIVKDSDFFGEWFSSGKVDLSCATGTMYIAFKYTGSGKSAFDGTYELDDVRIDFKP
ncbi:DUF5689 domain-containing protein [Snuella sedimenti]|uniref:Choice-of-anchor J domain-containing protein n=1 Tax=Snuella sedimenti TaxID=2798802 RepID=A0A8J7LRT3_9FLAO|nr:DUF5689 domain-containing protein [Snuella sedimenti]MBJ6367575.1 choice-of-anchor J domain-containing protein [Snuella sedimenti]